MNRIIWLLLIVLAGSFACSNVPKELGRTEAAEKIVAAPVFQEPPKVNLRSGTFCEVNTDLNRYQFEALLAQPFMRDTTFGIQEGLITVTSKRMHQGSELIVDMFPDACRPAYERLGRTTSLAAIYPYWLWTQVITKKALAAGIPATGGEYVVATKQMATVSGISVIDPATRRAEFYWHWIATPIATKIGVTPPPTTAATGTAMFRKYDDGWRVENVEIGK